MEVSDKTIAIILSISIVISLAGVLAGLKGGITGAALTNTTDTGEVNLTITAQTVIIFVNSSVNWGTGTVNETKNACTMDTTGRLDPDACEGFNNLTSGLSFRNDGNNNLSVQLNISKGAATFLGGTNPVFEFKITPEFSRTDPVGQLDDDSDSCGDSWTNSSYVGAVANEQWYICGNGSVFPLAPDNGFDDAVIDFNLSLPNNAPIEAKNAIITVIGTSAE